MLVRSKFFSQSVEKIEKLKLSLSKQHNKMLKIRSEMLKNDKIIKLGKNSWEHFPEIFLILGIPMILGVSEVSQEIILNFPVSR